MRWPWRAPSETRANATDRLVALIQSEAGSNLPGDARATAALETAAKLYEQAFAAARVTSSVGDLVTPAVLSMAARALIQRGEIVFVIDADPVAGLTLLPSGSFDVHGGPIESSWFYRCDLAAPSGSMSRTVPSAGVVHLRWGTTAEIPWRGNAPMATAASTSKLSGALEAMLASEVAAPQGYYLAVPKADAVDPKADTDGDAELRADIRRADGKQLLVESMADSWGAGPGAAPRRDWSPVRFGADPPEALFLLRSKIFLDTLSSCGVPLGLIENADGTAMRESLRRFVMTSCQGMARLMAAEFTAKIAPIEIDFTPLYGHDLVGRSQAYSRLVGEGKLSSAEALKVVGL